VGRLIAPTTYAHLIPARSHRLKLIPDLWVAQDSGTQHTCYLSEDTHHAL